MDVQSACCLPFTNLQEAPRIGHCLWTGFINTVSATGRAPGPADIKRVSSRHCTHVPQAYPSCRHRCLDSKMGSAKPFAGRSGKDLTVLRSREHRGPGQSERLQSRGRACTPPPIRAESTASIRGMPGTGQGGRTAMSNPGSHVPPMWSHHV